VRLTRRGWVALTMAVIAVGVLVNIALGGKCWDHAGFGYTTCEWKETS